LPAEADSFICFPQNGQSIVYAMFDATIRCHLNYNYCFKKKEDADMSIQTDQDAVIWLIYAGDSEKEMNIYFMGGEPLLRQDFIRKVVSFGKERCQSHGKKVTFVITTNTTLVTSEFVEYANSNGIGFYLFLDGIHEVQNDNRPLFSFFVFCYFVSIKKRGDR
jgi:uncharacterized protein